MTVEKKEGKLKGDKEVTITDLPGIYSLSPYTPEEVVARNYLIKERPDAIINIVDGTNIERNLYLSTQILELGIPVVLAVNMMDIVQKSGGRIDGEKLAEKMGCSVVEISALKGNGIDEAIKKAVALAKEKKGMKPVHRFAAEAERAIGTVEVLLAGKVPENQERFFAIKLLEGDERIREMIRGDVDVSDEIKKLEERMDDDAESIIANERYTYISSIIGDCAVKGEQGGLTLSDKIDRIVTNRILALPIFALVMFGVYYIAMVTVGAFRQILYPDVGRRGLRRAGDYGLQNHRERQGPKNDDHDNHIYPLRRKDAGRRPDRRGAVRRCGMGGDQRLLCGSGGDHCIGHPFEKDKDVCGGTGALCDGTSGVPYADGVLRAPQHVGERVVLYQEGRYDHSALDHRSVVFNAVRLGGRQFRHVVC